MPHCRRALATMHEDEKNGSDPIIFAHAGICLLFALKSFLIFARAVQNAIKKNVSGRVFIGIDANLVSKILL